MSTVLDHLDDTRPLPLASPEYVAAVRSRGTTLRRRRAAVAAGVPLATIVAAVLAFALWPDATLRPPPPVTTPTPTSSLQLHMTGCGHGGPCPPGTGPFRAVLDAGRGRDRLAVDLNLPTGYEIQESGMGGIRVSPTGQDSGLAVLWPVRGLQGSDDARSVATALAASPTAQSRTPQQVDVDGRTGWRVVLHAVPGGAECVDPTLGLYLGENHAGFGSEGTGCAPLLQRVLGAASVDQVGVSRDIAVEVTLVSGLGLASGPGSDLASFWRWGQDLASPASPSSDLLDGVRLLAYATVGCGRPSQDPAPCRAAGSTYTVHVDPIRTDTGIHAWHGAVTVPLPSGWQPSTDDGEGFATLVGATGTSSLSVLWNPHPPGTVGHLTARAVLDRIAADRRLAATPPRTVTLGGLPAWTIDLRWRHQPSAATELPNPCSSATTYGIVIACTDESTSSRAGLEIDTNQTDRLFAVQVADGQEALVVVMGARVHVGQQQPLDAAMSALGPAIAGLRIDHD